jgi:hypothetical protein
MGCIASCLVAFEAEFFKTVRPTSLLERFATIDEVADMIVYLCCPRAPATTGFALRVDGGVVRPILWSFIPTACALGNDRLTSGLPTIRELFH